MSRVLCYLLLCVVVTAGNKTFLRLNTPTPEIIYLDDVQHPPLNVTIVNKTFNSTVQHVALDIDLYKTSFIVEGPEQHFRLTLHNANPVFHLVESFASTGTSTDFCDKNVISTFDHNGYKYILTVVSNQTRLARFSSSYPSHGFTELKLQCQNATTAHTAALNQRNRHSMDENFMLYTVFETNQLCIFLMTDLEARFQSTASVAMTTGDNRKLLDTNKDQRLLCHLQKIDAKSLGFRSSFPQVLEMIPTNGTPILSLANDAITSIGPLHVENDELLHIYLMIGTAGSRFLQLGLTYSFSSSAPALKTGKLLSYVPFDPNQYGPFLPNPAFEKNAEIFYTLTQRSILRIPMRSCSTYTSCSSCFYYGNRSNDTFNSCHWNGSTCKHVQDVPSDELRNRTCPPVIASISPPSGPAGSRTPFTMTVSDLIVAEGSQVNVTMDKRECTVTHQAMDKIEFICDTEKLSNNETSTAIINLEVIDLTEEGEALRGYNIRGADQAQYIVKNVFMFGVYPPYGSSAGGTLLTIYGENLDIGTRIQVFIGHYECKIVERNKKFLMCKTSPCSETAPITKAIQMIIDDIHYEVQTNSTFNISRQVIYDTFFGNNQLQISGVEINNLEVLRNQSLTFGSAYEYRPRPKIAEIQHKGAAQDDGESNTAHTVEAGGTELIIVGENLDSVQYPVMEVHTDHSNATLCEVKNSKMIKCIIPALKVDHVTQGGFKLYFDGYVFHSVDYIHKKLKIMNYMIHYHKNFEFRLANASFSRLDALIVELSSANPLPNVPYEIEANQSLPCHVLEISDYSLKCKLELDYHEELIGTAIYLTVRVGNFIQEIDSFIGQGPPPQQSVGSESTFPVVLVVLLILTTLVAVLLVIAVRIGNIQNPMHKSMGKTYQKFIGKLSRSNQVQAKTTEPTSSIVEMNEENGHLLEGNGASTIQIKPDHRGSNSE